MPTQRQILSERSKKMKKNMTREESKLWYQFLRSYPINFVPQKVIGNYILDFYCKRVRLSIELDGSQHYMGPQKEYDKTRTSFLELYEIKVLRFPNSAIWEEFGGVCEKIHNEVQKRRNDQVETPLSLLKNKH